VDNASSDGSVEALETDSRIILIKSERNLGFGRANNLGYQKANGKYLFLLNSDTLLQNNAVKCFYDIAERESNRNVGCWGGWLKGADQNIVVSYGRFHTLWRDLYIQLCLVPYSLFTKKRLSQLAGLYNYKTKDGIVDYITGADIFMKKSVADQYGLFSPEYFLYCEETDMQKGYSKHGILSKVVEGPDIVHLEGGSQNKKVDKWKSLKTLKSKYIYLRKWNPTGSYYLYLIILSLFKGLCFLITGADKQYCNAYFKVLWRR
jgi:hypothetical protein